jgi:hypothetical protein
MPTLYGLSYSRESLAPGSVGDRRLEDLGHTKNLIIRAATTRPAINGDLLAGVNYAGDLVQIGSGGMYDRMARTHPERYIVMDVGMRDVDRDDQYCRSALRDCCLASHDGLAPGLFGGQDHVAINTTEPRLHAETHPNR